MSIPTLRMASKILARFSTSFAASEAVFTRSMPLSSSSSRISASFSTRLRHTQATTLYRNNQFTRSFKHVRVLLPIFRSISSEAPPRACRFFLPLCTAFEFLFSLAITDSKSPHKSFVCSLFVLRMRSFLKSIQPHDLPANFGSIQRAIHKPPTQFSFRTWKSFEDSWRREEINGFESYHLRAIDYREKLKKEAKTAPESRGMTDPRRSVPRV